MQNDFKLRLKFWGVRGSTPTPQLENLGYGGNTSCLEVRSAGGELLILDGGTGIRNLGRSLVEEAARSDLSIHMLLTHFHWDHIQGIPFFAPLYFPRNSVTFYAFGDSGGPEKMLAGQMQSPYFPVDLHRAPANKEFVVIDRTPLKFGDLSVYPFPLNHPQGAFGYRFECEGASAVYATDLEHGHEELDKVLREHAQNADILIYDAQYTPEEYESHKGWGHSTWSEGARVARESKVEELILFHHDPGHDDRMCFEIIEKAQGHFPRTLAAKELWTVHL
ncbi:MAG: MBL fold metallo-hydrolase [Acidobacteriota bacterium]